MMVEGRHIEHATQSSRYGLIGAAVLAVILVTAPWWAGRSDLRLLAEI